MTTSAIIPIDKCKPLAVFTSDWHLKKHTWAARPEVSGDAYRSALFIKNYCLQNGLSLFVLGDITDVRHPDAETVGYLMDIIDDLVKNGINFYFLQGQHELNRVRPWASCHRRAICLNRLALQVNNIRFYGIDFQPMGELQDELAKLPTSTDVLLAHQVWKERMGGLRTAENRPSEGAFAEIPIVKMVISGDFHAHKMTKHKGKDGQELLAVSPGSTYLKALDEDPSKYFYVLHDDLSLKSIKIPTRPVWRTRVGTAENLDKYIENFVAQNQVVHDNDPDKPVWYVEFRSTIADAVGRLERSTKGRCHLFPRPLREQEREDLINTDEVAVEAETFEHAPTALEDFLPRCCKPDSQVFNTAVRLNRAANTKEEVQQIVQEVIADADKSSEEGWDG